MNFKDLKIAAFMDCGREMYRSRMFSDNEVFCGPACETIKEPSGYKSIQTPLGVYDINEIIKLLPESQKPDLIIVKANSSNRNYPVKLSSIKCPKVLILGDTHYMSPAIRSIMSYAHNEHFDYLCSEQNRHHLHLFLDAGFKNLFWSPALTLKTFPQPFRLSRKNEISFTGKLWKEKTYLHEVIHSLMRNKLPVNVIKTEKSEAAKIHSQSNISLNCSLNGELNMRVFEILSSGGFLLTDKLCKESGMDLLLEEGKHYRSYSSIDELKDIANYYLNNEQEAISISKAGLEKFNETLDTDLCTQRLFDFIFNNNLDDTFKVTSRTGRAISFSDKGIKRVSRYEVIQDLQITNKSKEISLSPKVERRILADIEDLIRIKVKPFKHGPVDRVIIDSKDFLSFDIINHFNTQPFIELSIVKKSESFDETLLETLSKKGFKQSTEDQNCFTLKDPFLPAEKLSLDLYESYMMKLQKLKIFGDRPIECLIDRFSVNGNDTKAKFYADQVINSNRASLKALEVLSRYSKNAKKDFELLTASSYIKCNQTNSPLRILLITNLFPPQEFGGYGRLMADFGKVLQQRGHQVFVLSSDTPQFGAVPASEPGVFRSLNLFGGWKDGETFTFPDERIKIIREKNIKTLRSHIEAFTPDVCLLGNIDCLGSEILHELLKVKIPVIHHLGGAWPGYQPEDQPDNNLYMKAGASKWLIDEVKVKGYRTKNSCVVYPGALTDFFNFSQKPNFKQLNIAFAGILLPYKGPHLLLNSLAVLADKGINFSCEIAGTTTDERYVDKLKEFTQRQGLFENVKFSGFLDREGMRKLYARTNTLVFPTIVNEAFGISQVEAMTAGLTVISSGTGGAGEVIQHGINGLTFDHNNNDTLTNALLALSYDREAAENLAFIGHKDALKHFNIVDSVIQLEEQFYKLLKLREPIFYK